MPMKLGGFFSIGACVLMLNACNSSKGDVKEVYYDDGKTLQQRIHLDGKTKHGWFEEFTVKGQLKARQFFVHDTLHDTTQLYYPDGKLKTLQVYNMGLKSGCWKEYNKEGGLVSEINFKQGVLDGTSKEYTYRTGKLLTSITYKEGQKDGVEELYYANGQLMSRCRYDQGRPVPGIEEYTETGKPIENAIEVTTHTKNEMLLAERVLYYFKCTTSLKELRAYECLPVIEGKGVEGFRKLEETPNGFTYMVSVPKGGHVMSTLNIAFMAKSVLGNTYIKVIEVPIAYDNL